MLLTSQFPNNYTSHQDSGVIVNILEEPRKNIDIILPDGEKFTQGIAFEHLPKYCRLCLAFGHATEGCPGPEDRERERIRRAKLNRPKSRVPEQPKSRDPSRGPVPVYGRDKSRGRSKSRNPALGKAQEQSGVWMPAAKYKGKGVPKQQQGIQTSNTFASLEIESGAGTCPAAGTVPAIDSNVETQAREARKPPASMGVTHKSPSTENLDLAPSMSGNVPEAPIAVIDDDPELAEDNVVAVSTDPGDPVFLSTVEPKGGHEAVEMNPEEFPPLQEAKSGKKGRRKGRDESRVTPTEGSGRPPKDPGSEVQTEPAPNDQGVTKMRARSKSRDANGKRIRDPARSKSRGRAIPVEVAQDGTQNPIQEQAPIQAPAPRRKGVSSTTAHPSQ